MRLSSTALCSACLLTLLLRDTSAGRSRGGGATGGGAGDYYEVLGVRRDATDRAISRAYHRLAMKYHPDRNPGDPAAEKKFMEVAKAHEVLGDKKARQRYDTLGYDQSDPAMVGASRQNSASFKAFDVNIDDLFRDFNRNFGDRSFSGFQSSRGAGGGLWENDLFDDFGGFGGGWEGAGEMKRESRFKQRPTQHDSTRQRCHTVTRRQGNTVTTETTCS